MLTGEAGIGKTRLAAELGRVAQAEGGTVLYGRPTRRRCRRRDRRPRPAGRRRSRLADEGDRVREGRGGARRPRAGRGAVRAARPVPGAAPAGGHGLSGAAAYHLGQLAATLGDWHASEGHLVTAVESHRRLGAEPWVALSQHALAGVLRVRGARDRAEVVAAEARAIGSALGLRPLGGPLPFES